MEEELKNLLERNIPISKYRNKTFFITGATGLIGSMLAKSLLFLNREEKLGLKVVAGIRSKEKAEQIFNDYMEDEAIEFLNLNLGEERILYNNDIN